MKKARSSIQLDQIGIDRSKLRRAANGGYIIEIPGPDNHVKADTLASKLKVLPEGVRVGRLMLKGEMRVMGFEDSVTQDEIIGAIIDEGGGKITEDRR